MLNHLLYFRYALAHRGHGAASRAAPASSEWAAFARALGRRNGLGPGRTAPPVALSLLRRDTDNAAVTSGGPAFLQAAE
jgi:hypothetical protein